MNQNNLNDIENVENQEKRTKGCTSQLVCIKLILWL